MTLLNEADKIYLGSTEIDRIYAGSTLIWEWPSGGGEELLYPSYSLVYMFNPGYDRQDFTGEVGVRILTNQAQTFNWIGLMVSAGNSGIHRVNLYDWFTQALLATATFDLTGKMTGTYVWIPIEPVTLAAGGYYALLKEVTAGDGQNWANNGVTVMSPLIGNIYATYRTPGGAFNVTSQDMQFVGVNLGWGDASIPELNPNSIPGLAVWHKAEGIYLGDGDPITEWPNLGSANQATIVGTPPTFKGAATITGKPAVRFSAAGAGGLRGNNGSIYYYIGSGWQMRYTWTMLYVARRWGPTGGRCFTAPYPEGSNCLIGFHTASYDCMHDAGGWLKVGPPYPATPPDPWRLYGADNQGGVGVRFFINGVDVISGPIPVAGDLNYMYNINGYQLGGGGETGDFDVCELLIYDRKLDDSERQSVENYLRTRYGV